MLYLPMYCHALHTRQSCKSVTWNTSALKNKTKAERRWCVAQKKTRSSTLYMHLEYVCLG
jgi:hypothetical protein